MAPVLVEIQPTDVDLNDGVRGGMTALPAIVPAAAGGIITRGTGDGQLNALAGIISGLATSGGQTTTQTAIAAVQNNTRTTIGLPGVMERPDAGNTRFKIYLNNYDTAGNMEAPDAAPTVAVANESGTDRSGNLQHPGTHAEQTTMVEISTGRYWIEYEMASDHTMEALNFTFSIIEGAVTRYADRGAIVVDTTAVDFTAADRTILERLTAERADVLTDWIEDGRLDVLLDAIPTTAMRGTDGGPLAALWTDARAGYIDQLKDIAMPAKVQGLVDRLTAARAAYLDELAAANLPTDVTVLMALQGRNRRIDNITRVGGKITGYRLRLYGNAADAAAETDELLTINATGTYAAGLLTDEMEIEA